jgi:hypothetical protein
VRCSRLAVLAVGSALVLAGCGGGERESECGGDERQTAPGTYVTVWLVPHTDEATIRGVACALETNPLVASVYVSPGETEEPPRFVPALGPLGPGGIEVAPRRAKDAGRIRAYVYALPNARLVDDVIISHVSR